MEAATGTTVVEAWEKMSKSKLNGVDPEEVLQELGCDAARLLLLADVAPTSHRKWSKDSETPFFLFNHSINSFTVQICKLPHYLSISLTFTK